MRRLLCIVGVMDVGGAETFLMKVFRSLDRTKYMLDFAVASSKKGFYDDEILKLGGRIFHIPPKSTGLFKNFNRIRQIVKENSYKSVLRISQHSLSALELLAAWLGGARIRAFRSSNSNTVNGSKMELFIHKLCLFMPKLFANVKIAPSTESAVFMFGKRCLKKKKVAIVKNGIDLSFYKYSDHERERIRKELSINDCFVVGHIGRFSSQKNHPYLIKIFKEIKKKNENSLLLGLKPPPLCGPAKARQQFEGRFGASSYNGDDTIRCC